MKEKYCFTANWHGEIVTGYTHATTKELAEIYATQQLAQKLQRTAHSVRNHLTEGNRLTVIKR